jgi:hypothetical protein
VACLALLGREEEAALAAKELLARRPGYSLARTWADYVEFFHAPEALALRMVEGLRRAGIPETSDTAGENTPASRRAARVRTASTEPRAGAALSG